MKTFFTTCELLVKFEVKRSRSCGIYSKPALGSG